MSGRVDGMGPEIRRPREGRGLTHQDRDLEGVGVVCWGG